MSVEEKSKTEQRATYITLIGSFATLLGIFSFKKGRNWRLKPLDLALLSLSAFRVGHLVAYDKVTEPLRQPLQKLNKMIAVREIL